MFGYMLGSAFDQYKAGYEAGYRDGVRDAGKNVEQVSIRTIDIAPNRVSYETHTDEWNSHNNGYDYCYADDSSSDWDIADHYFHYGSSVYPKNQDPIVTFIRAQDMIPHCTRANQWLPYALEPIVYEFGSNHQRVFLDNSLEDILEKKRGKEHIVPKKKVGTHEQRKLMKKVLRQKRENVRNRRTSKKDNRKPISKKDW